ncbi:MAG: hypothetical protein KC503_38990 [Myxococcales bacterium]|nr:hypothetical protein [Myxococcales bacterium]
MNLKPRQELAAIYEHIASDKSPVGMDAIYVHALILDKLEQIEARLARLEAQAEQRERK